MSIDSMKVRAGSAAALLFGIVFAPIVHSDDTGGGGNQPPIIKSLKAVQVPGKKFRISGTVTDETPAACGVVITGAASGVDTCDANGAFDGIYDVATPAGITAVAGDGQLSSAPVGLVLANVAPATTIRAIKVGNNWIFSGTVTDEASAGLTVTLNGPGGLTGQAATVLANGSWSLSIHLLFGANGTASATVTDWYGLQGTASTPFGP